MTSKSNAVLWEAITSKPGYAGAVNGVWIISVVRSIPNLV